MTVYPPAPSFTNNQRLSASAHLNRLTDSADWLIGAYQRDQVPFERRGEEDELDEAGYWWRVFTGYIYHKKDTLSYKFAITQDGSLTGEIRVMYGDDDLTPHPTFGTGAGDSTITGTLDASGVDTGIVRVTVDFRALLGGTPVSYNDDVAVDVVYLRETQSPSYAALASFADATTPTAAEWQELSDNADELYQQMIAPHRPMPGMVAGRAGGTATLWSGQITHQHNYLFYDLRLKAPTNERDPAHDYVFATYEIWLEVNGTTVFHGGYHVVDEELNDSQTEISFFSRGLKLAEGDVIQRENGEKILLGPTSGDTDFIGCTRNYDGTEARATQYGSQWRVLNPDGVETAIKGDPDDDSWDVNYSGVADLSGLGLSEGTDYLIEVKSHHDVHDLNGDYSGYETRSKYMIGLIAQQTEDIGLGTWVDEMPFWEHGDYVIGTDGVKTIRDNLTDLESLAEYHNYPCGKAHTDASLWGVRRHRWLMYRHDEGTTPQIGYDGGPTDGWTEVNLPTEPNKWLAFDMDSLQHFWVGMRYKLTSVDYAIEDLVPYAED